jgi:hypothetical protein
MHAGLTGKVYPWSPSTPLTGTADSPSSSQITLRSRSVIGLSSQYIIDGCIGRAGQDTDGDVCTRRSGSRHPALLHCARIPGFVDRHYSLRGTLALHRAALGWDVVRAPINLTMAAPALALHLAAAGLRRIGARRCADALGRRRLLLHTSVARRVESLVCHELLQLPTDSDATRHVLAGTIISEMLRERPAAIGRNAERLLQRTVAEYADTRVPAAEIATGLLSLGTGAPTFGKLTPGVATFAPMLASMMA